MTAKVASPASPAEDLACRGPLKAKRSLYTEDQLSFTRKVSQTPTKQGHSVVCGSFIRLPMIHQSFLLLLPSPPYLLPPRSSVGEFVAAAKLVSARRASVQRFIRSQGFW